MEETKKSIILFVQGGAGDVLSHEPMIRSMRKAYPDDSIIVASTYSQLFDNNPNIDEVVPLNKPQDFYSEYVKDKQVRFFKKHFIYDHIMDEPAKGVKNLQEFICNVYGVKYDGQPPNYYISEYEKRVAETFMQQNDKPKVLLHIFGAVASDGGYGVIVCGGCGGNGFNQQREKCTMCKGTGKIVQRNKTNSLKDLDPSILAPLVEKYRNQYDFLQIGLEGEPLVPGAYDCLGMPMRDVAAIIPHSKTFIFIESLFAHIAGALRKPGIVVFQNTDPDFFGYPSAFNTWDSGGCKDWPCNRPVGALLDLLPGYKNPKTQERLLWECKDQKCAKLSVERLEEVFLESVKDKEDKKEDRAETLQEARKK